MNSIIYRVQIILTKVQTQIIVFVNQSNVLMVLIATHSYIIYQQMIASNLKSQKDEEKSARSGKSQQKLGDSKERSNVYFSKFKDEQITEDRLRKSNKNLIKTKSKTNGTTLVTNDIVTVREQKSILNSVANNAPISGFEDRQFQEKEFKKFTIHAVITEKNLIKESNYFDESHYAEEEAQLPVNSVAKPSSLNFNTGNYQQFQMFQVKTYLFDRNLKSKLTA